MGKDTGIKEENKVERKRELNISKLTGCICICLEFHPMYTLTVDIHNGGLQLTTREILGARCLQELCHYLRRLTRYSCFFTCK